MQSKGEAEISPTPRLSWTKALPYVDLVVLEGTFSSLKFRLEEPCQRNQLGDTNYCIVLIIRRYMYYMPTYIYVSILQLQVPRNSVQLPLTLPIG